jgi:predicted Zn finger-like uncharacterized protein
MLTFTCPHCGARLQVPEQAAGKQVQCGSCHKLIQIAMVTSPVATSGSARHAGEADHQTLSPAAAVKHLEPTDASVANGINPAFYDFLEPAQSAEELGRLGGYRILKVLGVGGMGVVFLAENLRLGRRVALKALLATLAANPVARERFLREARAAAALEHDHVVTLYEVGEVRGIPYLTMQLLEGETLEGRLRRDRPIPVPEVLRIGREVGEALAAAHAKGLVHRDIKPSNLWLEAGRGRVKVLDFGLVGAAGCEARLTQAGVLIGSPGYMAPELVRGGVTDPRADLFSLGCVLYRMCTGVLPFPGTDVISILAAIATETPRPIREQHPAVPPALAELVMRMLSKDPAGRPSSARAVCDALSDIEAESAKRPAEVPSAERRMARATGGKGKPVATPAAPHETMADEPVAPAEEVDQTLADVQIVPGVSPRPKRTRYLLAGVIAALLCAFGVTCLVIAGTILFRFFAMPEGQPADPDRKADGPQTVRPDAERWTVLFRSDDPTVWDTDSKGEKFAIPLKKAPTAIHYLRLRRMDTGQFLIVAMTRNLLHKATQPDGARDSGWNGTCKDEWGARHLGIAQGLRRKFPMENGRICILNDGWDGWFGSGFGHKAFRDNTGQYYSWEGFEIPKTVFEIAVTAEPLTAEEQRRLIQT